MEPIRVTDPETSVPPARIGLIVFSRAIGNRMPILVRMGSRVDACAIPSTGKVQNAYGTHPGHRSRDIHAFGPNRFHRNSTSRREQNADLWPDGLGPRCLHYPRHVVGGGAI